MDAEWCWSQDGAAVCRGAAQATAGLSCMDQLNASWPLQQAVGGSENGGYHYLDETQTPLLSAAACLTRRGWMRRPARPSPPSRAPSAAPPSSAAATSLPAARSFIVDGFQPLAWTREPRPSPPRLVLLKGRQRLDAACCNNVNDMDCFVLLSPLTVAFAGGRCSVVSSFVHWLPHGVTGSASATPL